MKNKKFLKIDFIFYFIFNFFNYSKNLQNIYCFKIDKVYFIFL
jgi:hypothetical protein